ncbi:MAG TPA: PEP-CTERM sorting domain-containing protein [Candidatus Eisenbacteria bacterium]|nr:PEP-CTERM sorting domain-containing protein [Candidatus Eisenbacteria bacterium]
MKTAVFASALLAMVTSVAIATNRIDRNPPEPPAQAVSAVSNVHDNASQSGGSLVPEPATMVLASLGLLAIGSAHRRSR